MSEDCIGSVCVGTSRGEQAVPIDLVGCISADHVKNSFISTRMILHPRIDTQNFAVVDDDVLPVGDEAFDMAAGQRFVSELVSRGHDVLRCCGR